MSILPLLIITNFHSNVTISFIKDHFELIIVEYLRGSFPRKILHGKKGVKNEIFFTSK